MKYAAIVLAIGLGVFATSAPAHAEEAPVETVDAMPIVPADVIDAALIEAPEPGEILTRQPESTVQDAWLVGGAEECEDPCAPEPLDPCDPWSGSFSFGLSTSQGNSDRMDFQLRGEVIYEKGPWYFEARFAFVYGRADGIRTTENYHGEANARRKLSNDKTYVFVKYNFDKDILANLEYRHRLAAGIGHTFIDRKYTTLNGEAGIGYVIEKRLGLAETQDPSAYLGVDYEHRWEDESKFHVHLDYFPNLNDFDLSLLTVEARYTKPLFGAVNLLLGARVDWVLDPPAPADPVDLLLIVGLDVGF